MHMGVKSHITYYMKLGFKIDYRETQNWLVVFWGDSANVTSTFFRVVINGIRAT